jgi:hypothetical protein
VVLGVGWLNRASLSYFVDARIVHCRFVLLAEFAYHRN